MATLVVVLLVDLDLPGLAARGEDDVAGGHGDFQLDERRDLVLVAHQHLAVAVGDRRATGEGDHVDVDEMRDHRGEARHLRDEVVAEGRLIGVRQPGVVEELLQLILRDLVAHAHDGDDDPRQLALADGLLHVLRVGEDLVVVVEGAIGDDHHEPLRDGLTRRNEPADVIHEVAQRRQQEGPAAEVGAGRAIEGHGGGLGGRHLRVAERVDAPAISASPVGHAQRTAGVHAGQVGDDRLEGLVDLVGRAEPEQAGDSALTVLVLEGLGGVDVEANGQTLDRADGQHALDARNVAGDVAVEVDERRLGGMLVGTVGHGKALL